MEMTMEMTEEEICRDYRLSKKKAEQINILADRNLTSREEIEDVLRRGGEPVGKLKRHRRTEPKRRGSYQRGVRWTVDMWKTLRCLCGRGMTAQEIAPHMGLSTKQIENAIIRGGIRHG